ncbi:protein MgtS, partial [Salmonella enterica]
MLGSINLFIVVLGIILFSGFLAAWGTKGPIMSY